MMEYDGNHKYEVIFVNEWDQMELVGFYDQLKDSYSDLNDCLEGYLACDEEDEDKTFVPRFGKDETLGELVEYSSAMGMCFDMTITCTDGDVKVRGFCF